MGTHGQSNFLGINYQAWSALALFLQYLRDPEFVSIHLESPKLQDFDLLFSDGRKIICEAKAWSRNSFGETSLKKLLDDIGGRGEALKDNDSILIVTKKASKSLKRFLRSARYISSEYSYELVEKSAFEFEQLPILAKVEIWETDQENCIQIALSLMAELLGVWVSSESLLKIVQSFLIEKIYHGSATGKVIKRQELLAMIDSERKAVRLAVGADQTPTAERLTLIR
ncbi:MAG: hypothetical protein KDD53_11145, partial [Bdellovibrionales bacterium]|nr:hypothetical protein [Bdellovibrionales bacterium]